MNWLHYHMWEKFWSGKELANLANRELIANILLTKIISVTLICLLTSVEQLKLKWTS